MTTLHERLSRLYDIGHQQPLPDPVRDGVPPPDLLHPAAVLIAVTERERPGVLLTHRPETMRKHAGQAAFPGGRIDPGENPVEAALREAEEELGIDPAHVQIIGASDPFHTRTGFAVTPVLATVPADLPLRPNPAEVAEWFEPPFAFILDPANQAEREIFFEGAMRRYIEIMWHDPQGKAHRIWGVTAAIIANLAQRISHEQL